MSLCSIQISIGSFPTSFNSESNVCGQAHHFCWAIWFVENPCNQQFLRVQLPLSCRVHDLTFKGVSAVTTLSMRSMIIFIASSFPVMPKPFGLMFRVFMISMAVFISGICKVKSSQNSHVSSKTPRFFCGL